MNKRNRRLAVMVGAGVPLVASALPATSAEAEPNGEIIDSCSSPIRYKFLSGFNNNEQLHIVNGFIAWDKGYDFQGNQVVDSFNSSTPDVELSKDFALPAGTYASANPCESIRFNGNQPFFGDSAYYSANPHRAKQLAAIAGHELGHLWGLGHTGINDDSFTDGSLDPTMGTCQSLATWSDWAGITADDNQSLMSENAPTASGYLANGGFEADFGSWKATGGSLYYSPTGNFQGSRHLYFDNMTGSRKYIWQKGSMYFSPTTEHQPVIRHRSEGCYTAEVTFELYYRPYDYVDDASPDCDWPTASSPLNENVNTRESIGAWSRRGTTTEIVEQYEGWDDMTFFATTPNTGQYDYEMRFYSDEKIHVDSAYFA